MYLPGEDHNRSSSNRHEEGSGDAVTTHGSIEVVARSRKENIGEIKQDGMTAEA